MAKPRVLVLYSQSLFAQGLQRLLEKAEDFEVIGVDVDLEDAVAALQLHHPEAVVVDADDLRGGGRALLLQLLREAASLQVVCLIALDGKVSLYRREQAPLTHSAELLEHLRPAPGSP